MNTNPRRRDQPADHQDLAELLPAPGHPVLAQDRHRVLREHLMKQFTHESTHEQSGAAPASPTSTSPVSPVRRPGLRLVLVAAPLALVAVVGLGVVAVDSTQAGRGDSSAAVDVGGDTPAEHRESAAELLDRIALAAADRPAVTVRDDQYIYTRSQGSSDVWGGPSKPVRDAQGRQTGLDDYEGNVRSEQWDAVDGKREGLRRLVALSSKGETDTSWPTSNIVMGLGGGSPSFEELQDLPTDPDALLKHLKGGPGVLQGDRLTETVFEYVGAILDQASLLPDLSAALYQAVAKLPGVRVVENAKDGAGRTGIGLTYTDAGNSMSESGGHWVFDPKSLTFLGTSESALLEVGVADKKGEAPTDSPS
ncbi:hypothetical protein DIZ27_38115 [Streptomyces sp. NWU339]|uniref:CU044_5270 family protein n=1 Tax=Streptomyces sp. NWU339 TaxID=2185284 RepID=UPI000D677D25|nr:CU044_5270 family protein [Streptomyces sp. NWU339]PWI05653.1 hypothetical protein DIZ27_38115 [Streptomyces sp. NWU339]